MRKLIVMLMATSLLGTFPVLAAERHETMSPKSEKFVEKCVLQSDSIQDKIARMKAEIAKGEMKYSDEQLEMLEKKLKETNDFLDAMGKN